MRGECAAPGDPAGSVRVTEGVLRMMGGAPKLGAQRLPGEMPAARSTQFESRWLDMKNIPWTSAISMVLALAFVAVVGCGG